MLPDKAAISIVGSLLLFLAILDRTSGQTPLGSWQTGRSTFYDGIDSGNCGYENITGGWYPFRYVAGTVDALLLPDLVSARY
jgi:hypothetical protein